jgi:hypothetical protein
MAAPASGLEDEIAHLRDLDLRGLRRLSVPKLM